MSTAETRPEPAPGTLGAALALAEDWHAGQVDKLGAPYIEHVRRVVDRVAAIAPADVRDAAQVAAALHDTVEDCDGVTLDVLSDHGFAPEVVAAVDSVTKRPGEDYDDLIGRAAADRVGRWVKLADNLDNSDPARARSLRLRTRFRLARRYRRARKVLAAHGAVAPMG